MNKARWCVQQPVTQRFRFTVGEHVGLAGEGQEPGPGGEVGSDMVATSQAWLIANSREGNRPRPVSFAIRIRSSTRA